MNWKIFLIVLINLLFIVFPYNIIGCGPTPDTYDEHTTFFHNDLPRSKAYRPFYFINDNFLYNPMARDTRADEFSEEWAGYCQHKVSAQQAYKFICASDSSAIASVVAQLAKKQPNASTTRLYDNPMTSYLLQKKDTAALQYILFSKYAEVYRTVGDQSDPWTLPVRDSLAINQLIQEGLKGYFTTRNRFVKDRYAYQLMSLTFYNGRNSDCIWYGDSLLKYNPSTKALYSAALSYQAGALWRQERPMKAAYTYSRAFGISPVGSVKNYVSFSWIVHRHDPTERQKLLAQCRNDREKADLLALLILGSNTPDAAALKEIYRLAPGAPVLEVLAVREVNKIEKFYLTPHLHKTPGGLTLYTSWDDEEDKKARPDKWLQEAKDLSAFYHSASLDSNISNKALFETAAAYLSYITRDYTQADAYLDRAVTLPASGILKDQQALTRLLIAINKTPSVDEAFESSILPSVQWLEKKAADDKGTTAYNEFSRTCSNWQQFYRNLMTEVLAKRYHQQGQVYKEALCIGNGERMNSQTGWNIYGYDPQQTKGFIHDSMSTADLLALDGLLQRPQKSPWDAWLCHHFVVTRDEIKTTIATAYIREYRFKEALSWLRKIKDPHQLELERNPFGDPIRDWQDTTYSFDKGSFDKITYISTMASLMDKARNKTAAATGLYKLATGYYNMTYYGRAWAVVKFYRPSLMGHEDMPETTAFEKEYYNCYTAEKYYKQAMDASHNRNFRARCLFMMAKCSQKQVKRGASESWDHFDKRFMYNKYFPQLSHEYGNTEFYKEAFNTCSYLRDFVRKNK